MDDKISYVRTNEYQLVCKSVVRTPSSPIVTWTSRKTYAFPGILASTPDIVVATVEEVDEKLEFLLPIFANRENIIDKSHPDKWFSHRSLLQSLFQPTHKEISIGQSKLCACRHSQLLPLYLTIEFKLVIL